MSLSVRLGISEQMQTELNSTEQNQTEQYPIEQNIVQFDFDHLGDVEHVYS